MYYLYLLLFYGTQLVFDLFFNDTFIYYFFYVIVKERLAIEFIVLNCSINQKTHNNMSINIFPLSHQVGTIGRHAYSNHICFPAKGASLRSCSPSSFCRAIQIGRLHWYILRRWWQSWCQKPSFKESLFYIQAKK